MGEVRFGRGPRLDKRPAQASRYRPSSRVAVQSGFEDANSFTNVDISSKAAGERICLSKSSENLALFNNGDNGHSVPTTVPASAHPLHCGSPIQAESTGWVQGRDDRGQVAEYLTVFVVNLEIGSGWRLWLSEDICFANSRRYVRTGLFAGRVTVAGGVMRSPGLMAALGRVICSVPRGST